MQETNRSLSSSEAELYAAVLACSMGIGTRQMYEDLGVEMKVQVYMDATAGIAMMERQGLGSVKHVVTQYLWIQELVHNKEVERSFAKSRHSETNADLMTKSQAEAPMNYRSDGLCGAHDFGFECDRHTHFSTWCGSLQRTRRRWKLMRQRGR